MTEKEIIEYLKRRRDVLTQAIAALEGESQSVAESTNRVALKVKTIATQTKTKVRCACGRELASAGFLRRHQLKCKAAKKPASAPKINSHVGPQCITCGDRFENAMALSRHRTEKHFAA